MSPIKAIAVFMVILGLLMPVLSFTSGTISPAEITLEKSSFTVDTNSNVVVNFDFYETFSTGLYTIAITGNGVSVVTPAVELAYREIYHGSLSFTAPGTANTYLYTLRTYRNNSEITYDKRTISVIVTDSTPTTYTLITNVQDDNGQALSGAEVSINTGVIGTTGATGIVTKSDLIGSYTVTATKSDYNSDSASVNMIQDQTVTLTLEKVVTPVITSMPTVGPTGTPVSDNVTPSVTPAPTAVIYVFVVEVLDTNDPQEPISNAKVNINGEVYSTNVMGMNSILVNPGEKLGVVITKDGYNTFEKSYTVESDTKVKVTLSESGGEFFLNLDLTSENPFYDPEGILGAIPNMIAVMSVLMIGVGVVLFTRVKE